MEWNTDTIAAKYNYLKKLKAFSDDTAFVGMEAAASYVISSGIDSKISFLVNWRSDDYEVSRSKIFQTLFIES